MGVKAPYPASPYPPKGPYDGNSFGIFPSSVSRAVVMTSFEYLSCWVHKPQKVYTFSFIVGNIIPKSVKCIHSATKVYHTPPTLNPKISNQNPKP